MKISELIEDLEEIKELHGDLECEVDGHTYNRSLKKTHVHHDGEQFYVVF